MSGMNDELRQNSVNEHIWNTPKDEAYDNVGMGVEIRD